MRERLDTSRWAITTYMREVAQQIPLDHRILDAGAGDCRYRPLFFGRNYVGVDAAVGKGFHYGGLDALANLEALPFAYKTFDAALCMNLLEPFFSVLVPLICLDLDRLDRDRKRKIYTTGFSCKGYKAQS